MDNSNFAFVLIATAIALVLVLVYVIVVMPQNRARKNQQQVVEELKIGEKIVTVGGLIGKLTYLDREKDLARLEVAKGVEIEIIPAAISHPLDYMKRLRAHEKGK
ncbi:MAG: preprotein translocase subunit YajC [Anaerolineae bacterium]